MGLTRAYLEAWVFIAAVGPLGEVLQAHLACDLVDVDHDALPPRGGLKPSAQSSRSRER